MVFFELPDTERVLTEAAFWDIYYEHCSYFTPGSLARLFRRTGFEPQPDCGRRMTTSICCWRPSRSERRSPRTSPTEDDLERTSGRWIAS